MERNWTWFTANPFSYAKRIPSEWKNRDPEHRKELRYGFHYLFAKNLQNIVPEGKRILLPPQALLIYHYCKGKSMNEMNYDFRDFSLDLLMLHHTQAYTLLHMGMEESKIRTADYAMVDGPGNQPVTLVEIKSELTMNQVLAKYEPYLDYPVKNWTKQEMYDLVQQKK